VWAGTAAGVAQYNGSGWTVFTASSSGLNDDYVRSLAIDNGGNVWVGCEGGLSLFDGNIWVTYTVLNSGLPAAGVNAVAIDRNGLAWIGTNNGLVSYNKTTGTIKPPFGLPPCRRSLSAYNYPNPVTHSTTIAYTVPEEGRVTLRILTADGKVSATLINERKAEGKHLTRWNGITGAGGHLPPGLYIGDLVCGKKHTAWKMNLFR
jgi:hypothetical protein